MSAESQVITQLNDTLKILNDIGFLGIVLITGLVIAVGGVLWIYLYRNRGKGAEAIQQSLAGVTTVLATEVKDAVRGQSEIAENVAKITAGALELLSVMRPESLDTNVMVHRIDDNLSRKDGNVTDLLKGIEKATAENGAHLASVAGELKSLKTAIDTFIDKNSLSASEVAELRSIIEGAGAVIADIKAAQEDLRRATVHTARLATGEHAVLTVEPEEPAA